MTRIQSYPVGAPAWVDLGVDDVPAATAFYSRVLGWDFGPAGPDGWVPVRLDDADVAGIGRRADPDIPVAWSVYLAVDDVRARVARAVEAGGRVLLAAMDIEMEGRRMGSIAVIEDPTGAAVGMWQPGEHRGTELVDVPGAPTWFELYTRDSAAAREFYLRVFDLWSEDAADPTLGDDITLAADGQPVAEIHRMGPEWPQGIPPHWSVCFEVDDLDRVAADAAASGGGVVGEPLETRYGRVAIVRDSQGAAFRVLSPDGERP